MCAAVVRADAQGQTGIVNIASHVGRTFQSSVQIDPNFLTIKHTDYVVPAICIDRIANDGDNVLPAFFNQEIHPAACPLQKEKTVSLLNHPTSSAGGSQWHV